VVSNVACPIKSATTTMSTPLRSNWAVMLVVDPSEPAMLLLGSVEGQSFRRRAVDFLARRSS